MCGQTSIAKFATRCPKSSQCLSTICALENPKPDFIFLQFTFISFVEAFATRPLCKIEIFAREITFFNLRAMKSPTFENFTNKDWLSKMNKKFQHNLCLIIVYDAFDVKDRWYHRN